MNIKFNCSNVQVTAGYRPGETTVIATNAELTGYVNNEKEILSQLDIKEVFEWLNDQGYRVSEVNAA